MPRGIPTKRKPPKLAAKKAPAKRAPRRARQIDEPAPKEPQQLHVTLDVSDTVRKLIEALFEAIKPPEPVIPWPKKSRARSTAENREPAPIEPNRTRKETSQPAVEVDRIAENGAPPPGEADDETGEDMPY